ncbi:hypothetical protein FIBSPDRAFT_970606 [Athelia psychrophila]|uniref:Uncharacterized protein n=1 Tax=Athelia psychrophila TaxID=1759441 RepID=A0A167SLH0_9AGAM|nr:hypothetical protein FIBSPDRAFT_970606 [Fibularhizoctonia sp. CBS 109695]
MVPWPLAFPSLFSNDFSPTALLYPVATYATSRKPAAWRIGAELLMTAAPSLALFIDNHRRRLAITQHGNLDQHALIKLPPSPKHTALLLQWQPRPSYLRSAMTFMSHRTLNTLPARANCSG